MSEQNDGPWAPNLFGKQWDVFNNRSRILLVSGSRKSGKTIAVLHRIVRHAWETPGARIAIFAKSKSLAKDGGVWQDLTDVILPEWFAANLSTLDGTGVMEYTTRNSDGIPGPMQGADTRTTFFRIRNMYGGESEVKLFSIDVDSEVASKVKGKRFSMIYFSELAMFKTSRILTVTLQQLRMVHLHPKPGEKDLWHQWIADTNPDEELGYKSWIYKEWYERRLMDFSKSQSVKERNMAAQLHEHYNNFGLIEMFHWENPHLSDMDKNEIDTSTMDDDALHDSYALGKWGDGASKLNKHFAHLFIRNLHVVGDDENDQIEVSKNSTELMGGWDIGASINHASVMLDRRIVPVRVNDIVRHISVWSVLDELVSLKERIGLDEFTMQFMDKQREIEAAAGRKFAWLHWSDDSSINVFRPTSASYDYLEVMAASKGSIVLQGVEKPDGSVMARVRLLKRLLMFHRIFISHRCKCVIAMLESCRGGDSDREYVLNDEHKHIFDALTYPIYMTSRQELEEESWMPEARSRIGGVSIATA